MNRTPDLLKRIAEDVAKLNQPDCMNKKYMVAIKVIADNGGTVEGNSTFNTDEPLTALHMEEIKKRHCAELRIKGFKCSPENAVIYAVIPLDA